MSYEDVARAVREWPLQQRLDLITALLKQLELDEVERRRRMRTPAEMQRMLGTEHAVDVFDEDVESSRTPGMLADGLFARVGVKAPSDEEVKRWLDEARIARTS